MSNQLKNALKELEISDPNQFVIYDFIVKSLIKLDKNSSDIEDGLIARNEKAIMDLSSKIDRFTEGTCRSTVPQNKRSKSDLIEKPRGPKKNILGWIKDEYISIGWKFFDPIIENAEDTINDIIDLNKEEVERKKSGEPRKRCEAALIWHLIKEEDGVPEAMRTAYKKHKEECKKNEGVVQLDESD